MKHMKPMKKMKRLLGVLLAAVMVLAMNITAFAADDTKYRITINNSNTGHQYEAYQVFAGDLSGETLSNVRWGSGVDISKTVGEKTLLQALKDDSTLNTAFDNCNTAADVADVLATFNDNSENVDAFATVVSKYLSTSTGSANEPTSGNYVISNLPAGYYFVKDAQALTGHDASTKFILKLVDDVTVTPKSAIPTVKKEVQDETADAESGSANGWGATADHAINESFQFKLTATLAADTDYDAYEKYKVIFNDTMSKGVTFESIASVIVDGQTVENTNYTCTAKANQEGGNWTLTIEDIKAIDSVNLADGADVVVIYNAHLNEKADVKHESGTTTNTNKVYLQYSNNPNVGDENDLGSTEEDMVWVFTYEVDNTKVNATDGTPLSGAGFRLYNADGSEEISLIYDSTISAYRPIKSGELGVEMFSADETGVFNIKGLYAGEYTLKETTVPEGFNKCADVKIKISAMHSETEGSGITTLTSDSNLTNTIENKQGATLPETGGIGTTLFYVIGGILVIGAAVLLITKRRMNKQD